MKLSGSYQIKLEKQKVWEALNDPEILKKMKKNKILLQLLKI